MKAIAIWEPKYKNNTVLVACSKVKEGKNYIYFCCDKELVNLYSFSGEKIINEAPIVSNSKIYCYEIKIDELCDEGELPEKYVQAKQKEIEKYRKKIFR